MEIIISPSYEEAKFLASLIEARLEALKAENQESEVMNYEQEVLTKVLPVFAHLSHE